MAQSATALVSALARNDVRPACRGGGFDAGGDVADVRLVEIDHQQQRLGREELKAAQTFEIVAGQLQRAQRLAFLECRLAALHQLALLLELRRTTLLQILLEPLETPFDDDEVREDQLVFHRLRVARRIDRAGGVRDRCVAEGADDVDERVGVLVAGHVDERLRACFRRSDDVGELDGRRDPFLRVVHPGEDVEPGVGHLGNADVDVALAARRLFGAGHQLKQGRLAAGGETDQSRTEHEFFSLARGVRPHESWHVIGSDPGDGGY